MTPPPVTTAFGALLEPHHRRAHRVRRRAGQTLLPADEREFWSVSAETASQIKSADCTGARMRTQASLASKPFSSRTETCAMAAIVSDRITASTSVVIAVGWAINIATETKGNTDIQIRDAKEPEPKIDCGMAAAVTLDFKLVCIAVDFPVF
jgi:hypothetical protein